MLTQDGTTKAQETLLASRALELFCATWGLDWPDSYDLAAHEATYGIAEAQRVAHLITLTGCSFADARQVIAEFTGERIAA
jgi:Mn-dependent DtxR family transcriptional regulator